jgi:hypothetical protein
MQVLVSVFPYEEAAKLCGGALPGYISQVSSLLLLEEFVFHVLSAHSANIFVLQMLALHLFDTWKNNQCESMCGCIYHMQRLLYCEPILNYETTRQSI